MEDVNMVQTLEKNILEDWESSIVRNKYKGPYEYILDVVGVATTDPEVSRGYMRQLGTVEYSDAVEFGFDSMTGFAYYYIVKHFVEDRNLLSKMTVS
jgi:hypothetical protein